MLEITKTMIEAAEKAAEALEQIGERGKRYVSRGASGDISLVGDRVSEEKIINYLRNSIDSFTIVSEEKGLLDFGKGEKQDYFIIDPIDGSNNYRIGLAPYTISIAVSNSQSMNGIYSGVVYEVTSGRYFWAEKNKGAYFMRKRVHKSEPREKPFIVSINFSHSGAGKLVSMLKELLKNEIKIRALGSASWEACLVAKGIFDAFIEGWNRLRIVDIAAASIILKESNIPFIYDKNNIHKNPELDLKKKISFIASGSKELMQTTLNLL